MASFSDLPTHSKPIACFSLFVGLIFLLGSPRTRANDTNKFLQLPPGERPATWATSMLKPGVPNLHQVSPILFRGAQPTPDGLVQLERMGIKTVVNLRGLHDDDPPLEARSMSFVVIRFHTWHPEEEDMVKFLKVVTDPARQPVYVHCKRGIDRTGTMSAVYRIAVQGWTKTEAIREMTQGGFGYDDLFPNLVEYVRNLNIDQLKQKAGLATKQ